MVKDIIKFVSHEHVKINKQIDKVETSIHYLETCIGHKSITIKVYEYKLQNTHNIIQIINILEETNNSELIPSISTINQQRRVQYLTSKINKHNQTLNDYILELEQKNETLKNLKNDVKTIDPVEINKADIQNSLLRIPEI